LFCQTPRSPAAAATAAHGSRARPQSGLFCQSLLSPAAAATAAQGLRGGRFGPASPCKASKALMADFRRDSARRS